MYFSLAFPPLHEPIWNLVKDEHPYSVKVDELGRLISDMVMVASHKYSDSLFLQKPLQIQKFFMHCNLGNYLEKKMQLEAIIFSPLDGVLMTPMRSGNNNSGNKE